MRFVVEYRTASPELKGGTEQPSIETLEADNIEIAQQRVSQFLKSGAADHAILYVPAVQVTTERKIDIKKLGNLNAGSTSHRVALPHIDPIST